MSQSLTFMMGEFEAEFPCDRRYGKNHMWGQHLGRGIFRFGFSAYAVRLLQDVYFIDFDCVVGSQLSSRQEFGNIESKKAESGLYAPIDGQVLAINESLLDDPSVINIDKYGRGWLLEMRPKEWSEIEGGEEKFNEDSSNLLSPSDYIEHLKSAWEIAQRTIKGQANADD